MKLESRDMSHRTELPVTAALARENRILARGGSLNVVGAVFSAVTNFALVVVVTRGIGVDDAGRFFTVTSVFLVLQTLARLGADLGLVYFVSRFLAIGQQARIKVCIWVAFGPVVVFAIALALATGLMSDWIGRLVDAGGRELVPAVALLAVLLPIAVSYDLMLSVTRGFGRMRPTVVIEKIGRPLAQLIGLGIVVLLGGGMILLVAVWAAPYVLFGALTWRAMQEDIRSVAGQPHQGEQPRVRRMQQRRLRRMGGEFWRFTGPRSVASCAQILLQRMDIIIVAAMRGPGDAAIYAAATRFLVVGQLGNQAISMTVQPRLSALLARGKRDTARSLYQTSTAWLVLLSWPVFLLSAVYAPVVLGLFGEQYRQGAMVVVIMGLSMLVASGCGVVDIVLIMTGRTMANLGNTVLALGLNLALDLLLVPVLGILGAAIGWAVALLAANLVPLAQVHQGARMHPFGTGTLSGMALAAISYGVVPAGIRLCWPANDSVGSFLIAGLSGTVVFCLGAWRLRGTLELASLAAVRRRVSVPDLMV